MFESADKITIRDDARPFDPAKVKAVFMDADGTLVSFYDHEARPSAVEAIRELRQKGLKVCLATGRSIGALFELAELPFDGFVCSSGQFCLDSRGNVIRLQSLDEGDIGAVCDFLEERERQGLEPYDVCFINEEGSYFNHISESTLELCDELNFGRYPTAALETLRRGTWLQLMFFGGPEGQRDIMDRMPHSQATRWHRAFIDIMPQAGGKDDGLRTMAKYFGVEPEACIAFGDGDNDISMLKAAGFGIAMGGATPNTKAAADLITLSVEEDGIAEALKFLRLIGPDS